MLAIVPATWRVLTMRHSIATRVNVCVPLTAVDECWLAAIWSHSDVAIIAG
jgi:hypothetical protein